MKYVYRVIMEEKNVHLNGEYEIKKFVYTVGKFVLIKLTFYLSWTVHSNFCVYLIKDKYVRK